MSKDNFPEIGRLFSVVTVVRNAADLIEQTILSVLNQSYDSIEYIIIDGGSTDGTLEIINKYDSNIDLWISEPDQGIYDAMNKGIALANGNWVNFMNAGDVFANKSICSYLAQAIMNNDCEVIYGDFIAIDSPTKEEIVVKAGDLKSFWKGMIFSHQSSFVKTDILKRRLFDCRYKLASDYDQFYSLYCLGYRFKYLPVIVSRVIIGGLSYSRIKTVCEQISISNKHRKLSFRILYFINPLIMTLIQSVAGQKASTIIRRLKWKLFYQRPAINN